MEHVPNLTRGIKPLGQPLGLIKHRGKAERYQCDADPAVDLSQTRMRTSYYFWRITRTRESVEYAPAPIEFAAIALLIEFAVCTSAQRGLRQPHAES